MATPTDRTVPSPERDELEKFIEKLFDDHASGFGEFGTEGVDSYEFLLSSMKVAAFSARRAREKAIEECVAKLKEVLYSEERYQVDNFDIDTETVRALIDLKYKSPTN